LDRSLIRLDGLLILSREVAEQTGDPGKHRAIGTKPSLLMDHVGSPVAVSVDPWNSLDGALRFPTLANV
jgi:hypothetical protein